MGRRSRKRTGAPIAPPVGDTAHPVVADDSARQQARSPTRRARLDEAPPPPWAPVPLTEILILLGLVALVFALLGGDGARPALLATGLGLVTIATLELSLREHLAGYRSHSALLAGLAAVLVAAPLALWVRPAKAVVLIAGAVVFALAVQVFRELFRRRSGGMGWRA